MKPKTQPLTYLVLSAKGWGTGSALRAFYIAQAFRKRGHTVYFPKPLPTLPFWLDMALSKPYYFFIPSGCDPNRLLREALPHGGPSPLGATHERRQDCL